MVEWRSTREGGGEKGAYGKLEESKDEKEKRMNMEKYMIDRKEAKLAVMTTKKFPCESLYSKLKDKGEDKKIMRYPKLERGGPMIPIK